MSYCRNGDPINELAEPPGERPGYQEYNAFREPLLNFVFNGDNNY